MSTKHTPGPWHRNIRAGGKYPTVFAGRNTHVAIVAQTPSSDETEANIDLIAAAPDLLAALQWLVKCTDMTRPEGVADAVRAAIAKATGT